MYDKHSTFLYVYWQDGWGVDGEQSECSTVERIWRSASRPPWVSQVWLAFYGRTTKNKGADRPP